VTSAQHPIIVLPYACYQDLLAVISFMYKGEINITQLELSGLLNCAESLQVKGLAKINPLKASGLLQEVCQQNNCGVAASHGSLGATSIKMETHHFWKKGDFLSGDDEEAVEITEVSEDREENLVVDEGNLIKNVSALSNSTEN
jgi:hypothetical protein